MALEFFHQCWLTLKAKRPKLRKQMDAIETELWQCLAVAMYGNKPSLPVPKPPPPKPEDEVKGEIV